MRVNVQRGFTLIELLVVISIIGMLAALLLPAVQQGREAARRATCVNNQRQLALALMMYEEKNGSFPGYVNYLWNPDRRKSTMDGPPVGWMFFVLPYMDRADLFEAYCRPPELLAGEEVSILLPTGYLKLAVCPSDAQAGSRRTDDNPNVLSYVVNCGLNDYYQWPAPFSATVPLDWAANGVFHYNLAAFAAIEVPDTQYNFSVTFAPQPQRVSNSFIANGDGAATTLLLSENVDARFWGDRHESALGFTWQAGFDEEGKPAPRPCPLGDSLQTSLKHINEDLGMGGQDPVAAFARPSSYHRGGVVAAFCDAHVGFLSETIDYLVYCQLMTPRGKSCMAAPTPATAEGPFVPFARATEHPELQIYGRAVLDEGSY